MDPQKIAKTPNLRRYVEDFWNHGSQPLPREQFRMPKFSHSSSKNLSRETLSKFIYPPSPDKKKK